MPGKHQQTKWKGSGSGMFSDQALTWPKKSGSWGKQKNALYQPICLSLTSPTSNLIHQSVQCQVRGRRIPMVLFMVCTYWVILSSSCLKSHKKDFLDRFCVCGVDKHHQSTMIVPCFSSPSFGIAQRSPHLQYESTRTSKSQQQQQKKKKGYTRWGFSSSCLGCRFSFSCNKTPLMEFFWTQHGQNVLKLG